MSDLWKSLKIGDKVRVVQWPAEFSRETLHDETIELYEWLIDTKSVLEIVQIDEFGLPEGMIHISDPDNERWEYLLLNHDGLEVVTCSR